jgi:hypothetical protein
VDLLPEALVDVVDWGSGDEAEYGGDGDLGLEAPRGADSGVKPKTRVSKIDALKEIIRAWASTPSRSSRGRP